MLKRNKNKQGNGDNAQGISAGSSALTRILITALVIALVPILVGFAYQFMLRDPDVQKSQIELVSTALAQQQADRVGQTLRSLQQRLEMAASSPLALSAISSGRDGDIALVEKTMLDYFPNASSLRLVKLGGLGTAGLQEANLGLRNHIEVDLLRRTSQGEETGPESYLFENRWLTSVARRIVHPRTGDQQAVVMATFDNQVLIAVLGENAANSGHTAIEQLYSKGNFNRADEIASSGGKGENAYNVKVELNDGRWILTFSPSGELVEQLSFSSIPLIATFGLGLIAVLAAAFIATSMLRKALGQEAGIIADVAETRAEVQLGFEELVPLARKLRKASQRGGRAGGGRRTRKTTDSQDIADPMFQSSDMIDQDDPDADLPGNTPAPLEGSMLVEETSLLPPHIFRAYDIRGIADTELVDDNVDLIARAIAVMAAEQEQASIIVACDGRNTSPRIKTALVKGLLSSGLDVIDIGAVPTPMLYFATHNLDCRNGIMVTGSHNPAEYNGLKIVIDGMAVAGDKIQALRGIVDEHHFREGAGRLAKNDVLDDYIETIVNDVAIAVPLRIVVDAGNGIAGPVVPLLLQELGCDPIPLYCDVDGDFPNHHPDPSDEANLADLSARVVAEGADFGVALDGDGDRLCVVNSRGEIIRNDKLLSVYAQDVVSRNPGADVLFDVKCSRHLAQLVSRYGGRPVMWKTGHSFMKEKMQESGALLGGEFSGHMFFSERWFGFDDGLYSMARLAEIVSASEEGLDGLLADFPDSVSTPEIRIPVEEDGKFQLVAELGKEGVFKNGKITDIDGVRVDYEDGWGLVRASNTVPALTARFEAMDVDALERIKREFREQLVSVDPTLELEF